MLATGCEGLTRANLTPERKWQTMMARDARDIAKPKSVLDVGHPVGYEWLLDEWGCHVETLDPFVEVATHRARLEDFDPGARYDLVNLTSVIDYLEDPIAGLRASRKLGRWILFQGRLNTYTHPVWRPHYWVPTWKWVEERAVKELDLEHVEWVSSFGRQMFSVFGRTR